MIRHSFMHIHPPPPPPKKKKTKKKTRMQILIATYAFGSIKYPLLDKSIMIKIEI